MKKDIIEIIIMVVISNLTVYAFNITGFLQMITIMVLWAILISTWLKK